MRVWKVIEGTHAGTDAYQLAYADGRLRLRPVDPPGAAPFWTDLSVCQPDLFVPGDFVAVLQGYGEVEQCTHDLVVVAVPNLRAPDRAWVVCSHSNAKIITPASTNAVSAERRS